MAKPGAKAKAAGTQADRREEIAYLKQFTESLMQGRPAKRQDQEKDANGVKPAPIGIEAKEPKGD